MPPAGGFLLGRYYGDEDGCRRAAVLLRDEWRVGHLLPAAVHSESIYRLFGLRGLYTATWPQPDRPIGETIGYHLRTGDHAITKFDWQEFLSFADRQFKNSRPNE